MTVARAFLLVTLCSAAFLAIDGRTLLAGPPSVSTIVAQASSSASVVELIRKSPNGVKDVLPQLVGVSAQASASATANVILGAASVDVYATASAVASVFVQQPAKAAPAWSALVSADAAAAARIYLLAAPQKLDVFASASATALATVGVGPSSTFVLATANSNAFVSGAVLGQLCKQNPSFAISVIASAAASATVNVGTLVNVVAIAQSYASVQLSGSQVFAAVSASASVQIATQLKSVCFKP